MNIKEAVGINGPFARFGTLLFDMLFTNVLWLILGGPGIMLFILWHTGFSSFHYDRKVLVTIAIAVIWVVFFIVIYFNIYVRTKIRYLEVIREGRKYRDAINKGARERKKNLKNNK